MDKTIIEAAAKAAHNVNNTLCTELGDANSPAWDALTDAQREGICRGAAHALAGGSPEASHNLWLETRRAEGWVFGPVKDFAAKTSPNMIPYADLPASQREKDTIFQAVVRAVAAARSPR